MKNLLLIFQLILPVVSHSQDTDSLAISQQVDSLIQFSQVLTAKGDFEQALEVNAAAEALAWESFGPESAAYGSCAFNRGRVNYFKGAYHQAEKWYNESLSIREKVLGKEHPLYAESLNYLSILYRNMGNYEKAEPLYLESAAIFQKVFGTDHPYYASVLNNLANLYDDMGNYEKAESLYLESAAIFQKVFGTDHPYYASALNNLATQYWTFANYEKAEPLYLESAAIRKKALGKEHPEYAQSLNNLALLYSDMGNYKKAEPYYLESKAIREKALSKEHPEYAQSLNNLALLYSDMGNYEKAEPLYLESKAIREKALGKEHPDYAWSLNNLAGHYLNMGNYELAEQFLFESASIREKALGKEHPDYAWSLNNLAYLYWNVGNYEKAEPLYLESASIREKALGKEHPEYAQSLNNLANLYEIQTKYSAAESLMAEALHHTLNRLASATTFLSEQELTKYITIFQNSGNTLNAYINRRDAREAQQGMLPKLAYDHALFYKGFLLTAASRLNAVYLNSPESMEINLRLKGYRRRLAAEYAKPIIERKDIADLEEKANTLEKELARTVARYSEAMRHVKWQEVQAALPNSAIALEFVHFEVNFPHKTDSVIYAVLLLRPGAAQPQFIPLFEERELNQLLAVDKERKVENINDLYALAKQGTGQLDSEKKSLYTLIWEKIEASGLEGITTVYYSPSGVLHRLNLGAIAVDGTTSLSDRYNLVALNSTRQLVVPASITPALQDAVVIGGVNYDRDTEIAAVETSTFQSSRSLASYWTESGTRGESWNYLKWTEKEADRIAATLTAQSITASTFKGKAASEEVFKGIGQGKPSPRILHIATHGFFFPDPELKTTSAFGDREPVFKWSDNPMIRSGLVLAGANTAWRNETPTSPDMEDGILTAYEISQMNLSNTELVVLSACETGLGDIQGNEGVYGLQRAFKIAGAKYLIMSLWQVPDRPTMEFMTTFYKNWLEGNHTIPDAFRKTQREMRDLYSNPYLWAGFVLIE